MGFDLNTAKPAAPTAPPAASRGFDLASARPVDPGGQVPGGVAGNRNVGKPSGEPRDNALGVIMGVPDAILSAGSAAAGGVVGSLAGLGKSIVGGHFGTPQGAQEGEEFGSRVAEKIARPPATNTGRKILEGLATVAAPLAALPSAEIVNMGRAVSSTGTALRGLAAPSAAAADAADAATLANGTRGTLRELVTPAKPAMSGVGAADVSQAAQRVARAESLPVPVKLTQGQRTRDFTQTAFEQETAKLKEGEPLRNRTVEQNQQLLQNFDAFRDETGAQAVGLRPIGRVVDAALVKKYEAAKSEVRAAYNSARDAGEMAEPVPYKTLSDYLEKHSAEIDTNNVPMLAAVRAKLAKLDPEGTGVIPLNDMEELRKMAGRLTTPGTPNEAHVGDVKRLIDGATENAGGDLYREARRLNTNMANQFENAGAVDKLLRTKRGTNDRAVAIEDVADHIIDGGSVDDTRWLRRVLTAGGGDDGAQAWKEVRGAAVDRLKNAMFGSSGADTAGATPATMKRFDTLLKTWDGEGRLEVLFGTKGAAQLRDFAETARDILTSPEGTRNTSNTASALLRAWDKAATIGGSTPGLSTATKFIDKKVQSAVLKKRVDAAVNPDKAK